jgi:quercetin dioxygenase-like cupin family protein
MGVRVAGRERVLHQGEHIVLDPGTPHKWWNAGDEALRLLTDFRPALQTKLFFETL